MQFYVKVKKKCFCQPLYITNIPWTSTPSEISTMSTYISLGQAEKGVLNSSKMCGAYVLCVLPFYIGFAK